MWRDEMPSRRALLQYAALASVAMPYLSKTASADDAWPTREIHIFVRFYGKKLEDKLGKSVITENKAGAFGNISTECGEIQARRLHAFHRPRKFLPRRRTELVQETGIRSGQRLRTRDNAI